MLRWYAVSIHCCCLLKPKFSFSSMPGSGLSLGSKQLTKWFKGIHGSSSDLLSVNTHLALTCQSGLPAAMMSTEGSEFRNTQPADDAEKHPIEYKAGGWQVLYYWNKSLCSLDSRFTCFCPSLRTPSLCFLSLFLQKDEMFFLPAASPLYVMCFFPSGHFQDFPSLSNCQQLKHGLFYSAFAVLDCWGDSGLKQKVPRVGTMPSLTLMAPI